MSKQRVLTSWYGIRVLEPAGSGAVIGAIAFSLIVALITDAHPGPFLKYSPLIGGLTGGIISFLVILSVDFKRIKKFQEELVSLQEEKRIGLLQKNINSDIYPVQMGAIAELKKIATPEAYKILKQAAKEQDSLIREEINKVLREKLREG